VAANFLGAAAPATAIGTFTGKIAAAWIREAVPLWETSHQENWCVQWSSGCGYQGKAWEAEQENARAAQEAAPPLDPGLAEALGGEGGSVTRYTSSGERPPPVQQPPRSSGGSSGSRGTGGSGGTPGAGGNPGEDRGGG